VQRRAVIFGVQLWVAVVLALFVAYWLELDNPFWAGTSASIVCQPTLGASLRKGHFRAIGTATGAIAVVVLTAALPQSRVGFLAGLAIWCGACGFLATILRNFAGYAAALSGYTAAIIFSDALATPGKTFSIATTRGTEICIGILSAGIVMVLTDTGDARRRLTSALGEVARLVATGLASTVGSGIESSATRRQRRELIRRVIALDPTIDEALAESPDLSLHLRALHGSVEGLFSALSAWRKMASHLEVTAERDRSKLARLVSPAIAAASEADWLGLDNPPREACRLAAGKLSQHPVNSVATRIMVDGAVAALQGLQRGDCRKFWGQAAIGLGGHGSLAGQNFCPKAEPRVPL
jgi:uncharacterized membrane protein YccC